MVLGHGSELLLGYWAVLAPIEHLQDILFWLESLVDALLLLWNGLRLLSRRLGGVLILSVGGSLIH